MKKTNITIEERANMTEQSLNLRIENGENIDPREEIVVGDETLDSICSKADADYLSPVTYGKHRVRFAPLGDKDVVKSIKVVKNGVITETQPYIRLKLIDAETGKMLDLCVDRNPERDGKDPVHYTMRLYANMVDGLRRNVNREYCGAGATMGTKALLGFITDHSIDVWASWNNQYGKVQIDFFDREAWEAYKRERDSVGADTRKGSKARTTENKAIR